MDLKLVKKDFVDNFLNIVSKTVDIASIKVSKDEMYALCETTAGVLLLGKYRYPFDVKENIALNIGDIKKLLRVVDLIDEDIITFSVNSNHLHYKSGTTQFKYHFLDDAVIPTARSKKEKIEAVVLDTFFDIEYKKLQEILKASSFTSETNKIYLYGQPDGVYCELGDKEKANTDSISFKVAGAIEGQPLSQIIPFNLDIFRVLSGVKFEKARVGINLQYKLMSFFVKPTPDTEFKFFISGLVK